MLPQQQAHGAQRLHPFKLGLTGGIGSGKSTVAAMLAECGATVLDADAIARSLTAPGGAAMAPIAQTFGPQAVATDGGLDRDFMRARAFSDASTRTQLEAIVHPLVGQTIQARSQAASDQGARWLVWDIPLLVESPHWRPLLDTVLVVDCRPDTQIARVQARNGLSAATVRSIMAAQASREQRRAAADWVIFNDDLCLQQLRALVLSISAQMPL